MFKVHLDGEVTEFEATAAGLFEACTHAAEQGSGDLLRTVEYEGRFLGESAVFSIYDGGENAAEGVIMQLPIARGPNP